MDMTKIRAVVAEKSVRSNILVVGDVMLDKYYSGEVTRISPEAPVPISRCCALISRMPAQWTATT